MRRAMNTDNATGRRCPARNPCYFTRCARVRYYRTDTQARARGDKLADESATSEQGRTTEKIPTSPAEAQRMASPASPEIRETIRAAMTIAAGKSDEGRGVARLTWGSVASSHAEVQHENETKTRCA